MRETTPLGRLLRERRRDRRVSWKRLSAVCDLEPETMMLWERGVTKDPPISKVLLFAREVGVTLEELAEVLLGEPWTPATNGASSDRADRPSATPRSGASLGELAGKQAPTTQQRPGSKRRHPNPDEGQR